jgi:hypothetical protein
VPRGAYACDPAGDRRAGRGGDCGAGGCGGDEGGAGMKEASMFFFEKKNQKTFPSFAQTDKVFLLLFVHKKKNLTFFLGTP